MDCIIHNPYHSCGVLIARISVCSATIIWSLILLTQGNALGHTAYGEFMTMYIPEDVWAWFYGALSCIALYRIFRQSPPTWIGPVIYGLLFFGWSFVEFVLLLLHRPMQPTSLAWVTVGVGLSLYAFLAMPKTTRENCAAGP